MPTDDGVREIEEILYGFATGIHDYANGTGKPDDYRDKLNEAKARIEALIVGAERRIAEYAIGTLEHNSYADTMKLLQIIVDSCAQTKEKEDE